MAVARDDGEWWLRGAPTPMTEDGHRTTKDRVLGALYALTGVLLFGPWLNRYGLVDGVLRTISTMAIVMGVVTAVAGATGQADRLMRTRHRAAAVAAVAVPALGGALYLIGVLALDGPASLVARVTGGTIVVAWLAVDTALSLRSVVARRRVRA